MKKENRIKKNEEIGKIVKQKNRINSPYFVIYYCRADNLSRIAISVSKKYGCAVERNHAKRIVREIIRPNINTYEFNFDAVIVVKPSLKDKKYLEIKDNLNFCIKNIQQNLKSFTKPIKNNK